MTPARGLRTGPRRRPTGRTLVISGVRTKAEFIEAVLVAVQAPAWAGRNWDAVADLLGDLSWLPDGPVTVLWRDPVALRSADPAAYRTAVDLLRHAASDTRRRPVAVVLTPR